MILRFILTSFVFIPPLSAAFAEDVTSEPVIATLPDAVIIQHWKERIANTKTINAEFCSFDYDTVFKTVKKGQGKLFIKGKNQCRLEITSSNKKGHYQFWIWKKDNTLTRINTLSKTYRTDKVKHDSSQTVGFDYSLNNFPWYSVLTPFTQQNSPPKITVSTTAKTYKLTFSPTQKKDASKWSAIDILLDIKTEKIIGIQVTSPSGHQKTARSFLKFEINQHIKDDKGLFDFSLKGYTNSIEHWEKERKKRDIAARKRRDAVVSPVLQYLKLAWKVWHLI